MSGQVPLQGIQPAKFTTGERKMIGFTHCDGWVPSKEERGRYHECHLGSVDDLVFLQHCTVSTNSFEDCQTKLHTFCCEHDSLP
jgi:hypothetical protein